MDNKCIIIMPQGEPAGYTAGHFNRVYDYVIAPACRAAGYWPARADNAPYDNPLEVIKNIIDSEIALFDVSGNNENALYGFAIRQTLGLPVALIKDVKSPVAFNSAEFNITDYDDSLRIDTVQKAIEDLSAALKSAADARKPRYELLDQLGIGLPPAIVQETMFDNTLTFTSSDSVSDAPQEKDAESQETKLPVISPLPDYVGNPFTDIEIGKLKTGDVLFHLIHGDGKINFIKKMGREELASIQFESGPKLLVLVVSDFFRKVNK